MGDDDPPGLGQFRHQGHDWKDLFREEDFFKFSYCKSTDDDPRGVANLDPRSMIGRIYVGYH